MHLKNQSKYDKLVDEYETTKESAHQFFGFFRKHTKEEKIKLLQEQIDDLKVSIKIGDEFLKLAYNVVVEHELPTLRTILRARQRKFIKSFSEAKIHLIKNEEAYWNKINASVSLLD